MCVLAFPLCWLITWHRFEPMLAERRVFKGLSRFIQPQSPIPVFYLFVSINYDNAGLTKVIAEIWETARNQQFSHTTLFGGKTESESTMSVPQ